MAYDAKVNIVTDWLDGALGRVDVEGELAEWHLPDQAFSREHRVGLGSILLRLWH